MAEKIDPLDSSLGYLVKSTGMLPSGDAQVAYTHSCSRSKHGIEVPLPARNVDIAHLHSYIR